MRTTDCTLALALLAATASPAAALDVNSFRAQHGLKRLAVSGVLSAKARAHAADMARRRSMDHDGFIARMGGVGPMAAENVGVGCASAECVYKLWAESSGHRANMLMAGLTHYGLGSATGSDGRRYWALELANMQPQRGPAAWPKPVAHERAAAKHPPRAQRASASRQGNSWWQIITFQ
jgi:Cysteine-rich secretory protein family